MALILFNVFLISLTSIVIYKYFSIREESESIQEQYLNYFTEEFFKGLNMSDLDH